MKKTWRMLGARDDANRAKRKPMMMTAVLMVMTWLMVQPAAVGQVSSTAVVALTNFPATLAGSAVTNVQSVIPVYKDRGLALSTKFNAASGTATHTYALAPSVDGTNVSSALWPWIVTANSTTDVVATTNWSAATLSGYSAIVVVYWTNSATAAAIVTNKQLVYRIP